MVNAQEWLNKNYLRNAREEKTLNISDKNLESSLNLGTREFPNLEEFDCSNNRISKINFTHSSNVLSVETRSAKRQKLEQGIKRLNLSNNNFEQDLSFLKEFTNLEELNLANNKFFGSLESLKNLTKLKYLNISDTDIDSGWEYLPESLEEIEYSSETRKDAKVQDLKNCLLVRSFCQAAKNNDVVKVREFLSRNKNVVINLQDKQGNTALHYATSNENIEIVGILLQKGAKVNIENKNNKFTPLHIAVSRESREITTKLLEAEANPNAKDSEGNTPLHFASERNNLWLLKKLVKKGGEISLVNDYDWSVLHSAASGVTGTLGSDENWDIVEWLLKKGADKNAESNGIKIIDIFSGKDYSYTEKYINLLKKIESTQKFQTQEQFLIQK